MWDVPTVKIEPPEPGRNWLEKFGGLMLGVGSFVITALIVLALSEYDSQVIFWIVVGLAAIAAMWLGDRARGLTSSARARRKRGPESPKPGPDAGA